MTTETYQKVKQYLAGLDEGDFIYGDETNSSYSTESKASDLCISSLSDRPTPNLTLNRLTKPATPEVSHNPLRFISTKTSAEIFTQQAREQITQIEQQKKLREQFCVIEKESLVNRDEEIEWSATLEKWKNKRSSEIKKNLLAPSSFSARIQTNEVNHRSNKVIHGLKKDSKEEILTITSPSPDECTDSGIENNRYTSTPHSPSTSTDFSPRSDKNIFSSSGVDRRIISPTNRFIRPASPSIEDVPPPLPMNPPPPLPLEHEEEFIKDLELDMDKRDIDQNTSYKTPNRTSSEESLKLDQVVVGLTLKKDQTSESEYKSIFADRETIVKTTSTTYPSHFDSLTRPTITEQVEKPSQFIKETTANFNCQKTYEENARVDAVVAQQAHDSTSKHVIKEAKLWKQNLMKEIPLEISPLATMETTKKADSSRDKSTRTVSVGVEVCREQNAKVSAFKFPHKLSRESVVFTVKPASKMTPTVSHFRAVDIPFDDTPNMVETHTANGLEGGNLPDSNGLMVVKMQLSAAEFQGFDNHGFGFSIKGGKEQNAPLTVDTVVVNTAADRCGLQVGDIVLSINGESTVDRYYQTARRMLNEAIRLGEVEVQIQRSPVPLTTFHKDTNKEPESQLTKSPSFDDRRIVFERKPSESNSYYEFKQKKRFEGSPDSVAKASGSISSISPQSSKSSDYGHDDTASDHLTDSKESDSLQRLHRRTPKKMSRSGSPDYRVVSLDEKRDPGKLDDFVPEVEREGRKSNKDNEDDENTLPRVPSRKTDRNEEPKLIRNYDLNLVKSSNESLHSIKSRNSLQKESVNTTDGNKENDTSLERPVVDTREWRQFVREQRLPNPGHTSSLNRIDADSKFQIIHKPNSGVANISPTSRPIITTVHRIPSGNKHEVREIPVKLQTTSYASPQKPSRRNDSTATQQSRDEPIMSVSGKHRCAHCDQELGRGAAMIIESLNLFYHLSCFRCYVCNIALGNGTKGADVRVRDAKLHCQKCYSNDEVGMKFSQI